MRAIDRVAVFNRRRFDRRVPAVTINATQNDARGLVHRERVGTRMARYATGTLGHRLFGQLGPRCRWRRNIIDFARVLPFSGVGRVARCDNEHRNETEGQSKEGSRHRVCFLKGQRAVGQNRIEDFVIPALRCREQVLEARPWHQGGSRQT